ncbi:MAG: Rpn family recombination-promoting nuclease/putative transposase [Lachnospiraceae bacterium]|nr:Rpn family recombination-promoting nuclease/putative transposase [Lachnospiraceae bacterium]
MGEKDIVQKHLEDLNDVFADIMNVCLFQGEREVREEELEPLSVRTAYKLERVREQERDVAKYWKDAELRLAMCGFENQTKQDPDMPLRIMGYDGAGYRDQLYPVKDEKGNYVRNKNPRYPVITLVLYMDYRRRWTKPVNLTEVLQIPDKLRAYVSDYHINVINVAWLSEEDVSKFKSDFRFVADYYVQMRKTGEYTPPDEEVRHMLEVLMLMSELTGDHRFEQAMEKTTEEERSPRTMCEVLDRVENRGIEIGTDQGIENARKLFGYLLKDGRMDDLARATEDEAYCNELLSEYGLMQQIKGSL